MVGGSQAKVWGQLRYFECPSAGEIYIWGVDIRILTQGRFSIAKCRAESKVSTSSLSPGDGAYSRALKAEKS